MQSPECLENTPFTFGSYFNFVFTCQAFCSDIIGISNYPSIFLYFHASIETLYGQLDIPWFPVDAILPELPPSPLSDPIIQSSDIEPYASAYHIALMLFDEIQLVFPFTFSAF